MFDKGEVIEVNGQYLRVRVDRNISCGNCKMCSEGTDNSHILKTFNPGNIKMGDFVEIDIPEGKVVQSAFLLYGLPLLGLLAGFIVGSYIHLPLKQELVSFFAGIIGMSLAFLFLKFFSGKTVNFLLPRNVRKITKEPILTVKDPVCGMDVSIKNPAAFIFYNGNKYFFCSIHCKNLFQENSEEYVEKQTILK